MKSIRRRSISDKFWIWHKEDHRNYYHREDGPAIEHDDGRTDWWLYNDRIYSSKEYQKITGLSDCEMSFLILKYGDIS